LKCIDREKVTMQYRSCMAIVAHIPGRYR
jgi:hypothetical protein